MDKRIEKRMQHVYLKIKKEKEKEKTPTLDEDIKNIISELVNKGAQQPQQQQQQIFGTSNRLKDNLLMFNEHSCFVEPSVEEAERVRVSFLLKKNYFQRICFSSTF
jgi:hypothetical protein